MTGADLQWTEVEISPLGLNESVDERVLPPGQLVNTLNCEFTTKDGSLRKRPGTVKVGDPPSEVTLHRLVAHDTRNQLLAVDLVGNATVEPALYSLPDTSSDGVTTLVPRKAGNACNVLTRRSPIATDLESDIFADMAYVHTTSADFGFLVYGIVHLQSAVISVKVVKVAKVGDSYEPGETVIDVDLPYDLENEGEAVWVQAAPCLDRYVMVAWGHSIPAVDDDIHAVVVDCQTGGTPTVSTRRRIVSDAANMLGGFDLCESTYAVAGPTPSWIVVYAQAAGANNDLQIARFDGDFSAVPTTAWSVSYGVPDAYFPRAITVFEKNQQVWVNWYDTINATPTPPGVANWRYLIVNTANGASVLGMTVWCQSADVGDDAIYSKGWISGIADTDDAGEMVLFHSQHHSNPGDAVGTEQPWGFRDRPITRWRRVRDDGSQDGLRQKRGIRLLSKPWKDAVQGRYLAWCASPVIANLNYRNPGGSHSGGVPHQYELTAVLMKFTETGATAGADTASAIPFATAGGLSVREPTEAVGTIGTVVNNSEHPWVPRSVTHGNVDYSNAVVQALGRRTLINFQYVPTERKSGPWDVVFRTEENEDFPPGYGRYQSTRFGGSVYMAGGLLTQWDGDRHHENGFIVPPNINAVVTGTGGSWPVAWAESKMFLQAVYETVLDNGERVRSATSNVAEITLNGDIELGTAPTNTVVVYLEPMTVSMRTFGGANQEYQTPRTLVTVYGSVTENGQQLHRWFKFESDEWEAFVTSPDSVEPITFTLTGGNGPFANLNGMLSTAENEIIYNDSGELDNDHPYGGCSCLTVHKDRLWVGGGDEPEVLWYSKERVDGRPAEFAIGQQVRVPGSEVMALASLDDALIVLCRHAIYAIYGDGPNATGDPASGFFSVVPIATTVGCNGPSSVAVIPQGVMFRSEQGFHLLDRGRQLHNIGAPVQDTAAIFKVPVASVTVPRLQQARFLLGITGAGSEEFGGDLLSGSDVATYDWDAQKWSLWRYRYGTGAVAWTTEDVVDQKTLGDTLYILCSNGTIHREDKDIHSDSGAAYRQRVKTGWLSFGRVQGYKRMHKFGVLMSPNPWADYNLILTADEFPYGLKVGMDFNYAETGFNGFVTWNSTELGRITPQSGVSWLRVNPTYKKQPSIRLTFDELPAARYVSAVDLFRALFVDTTGGANVLKIKINDQAPFSTVTVTSFATWTVPDFVVELQTELDTTFGVDQLRVYQSPTVSDDLRIETVQASYLQIDSVANGSTLNDAIGLAAGGAIAAALVSPDDQSGFILQSLAFEIGMARGIRRLPATNSR